MEEKTSGNLSPARPWGVTLVGILLIVSSLMHIHKLIFEHDVYMLYYGYLPHWLMILRFSFSWLQRILGLTAGIGILFLKDICRKIVILIGCFTILTIYWKHPYSAFKTHTAYLDQKFGFLLKEWGYSQLKFSQFTLLAVILACVWDILFFGVVIYYLTRPKIKAQFK